MNLAHPLPKDSALKNLIPKYLKMWHKLYRYSQQEIVLHDLFTRHPLNDNLEIVVEKIALLNEYYSTNVKAVRDMALNILSIPGLDSRLKEGDISIVDEIKTSTIEHFSFASKFCSFHNPDKYPIYDSYVRNVLKDYQTNYQYMTNKPSILTSNIPNSYEKEFYPIISTFRKFTELQEYTFKQLDRFLWLMGKEYFVDYFITPINEYYTIILKKGEAFLYELCVLLHKGQAKRRIVGGKEYMGIASDEDFNFITQLLEEHCNYVSRKDGIIGDFYVDASDETIKVFHKTCFYNIKDGKKKNVLINIAETLKDKNVIDIEKYQEVCDNEMQEYDKKHPRKNTANNNK